MFDFFKKNKVAFVIPVYPPHFLYAFQLLNSWYKFNIYKTSDIYFVFTNEKEERELRKIRNDLKSIIIPENLRIFKNRGIINIKKIYGISVLHREYKYLITLDAESEFTNSINVYSVCKDFFSKKILIGNNVVGPKKEFIDKIKESCKMFYDKDIIKNIGSELYLWFNQPCIYDSDNIYDFLKTTDLLSIKSIAKLCWFDFDYYIYMYYLQIREHFRVVDIGIDSPLGAFEVPFIYLKIKNKLYKKIPIYMCSRSSYYYFNNIYLFLLIHKDR